MRSVNRFRSRALHHANDEKDPSPGRPEGLRKDESEALEYPFDADFENLSEWDTRVMQQRLRELLSRFGMPLGGAHHEVR